MSQVKCWFLIVTNVSADGLFLCQFVALRISFNIMYFTSKSGVKDNSLWINHFLGTVWMCHIKFTVPGNNC